MHLSIFFFFYFPSVPYVHRVLLHFRTHIRTKSGHLKGRSNSSYSLAVSSDNMSIGSSQSDDSLERKEFLDRIIYQYVSPFYFRRGANASLYHLARNGHICRAGDVGFRGRRPVALLFSRSALLQNLCVSPLTYLVLFHLHTPALLAAEWSVPSIHEDVADSGERLSAEVAGVHGVAACLAAVEGHNCKERISRGRRRRHLGYKVRALKPQQVFA